MEQHKSGVRAEVKLPLILIHTPFGLRFFDRVAKWPGARAYAEFNVYLMPAITALAIFLIVGSLLVMFSNAAAREGVRDIGLEANLLIPGLNPYLPITYGWIALVVTLVIHEGGHGIVARVYNLRVDSTGLVLFLGIPIGAFVNIEREELGRATLKQKCGVLTAGPLNNMILAGASLLALYFVISTLTPLPPNPGLPQFGVLVVNVSPDSLAQSVGLTPGSVIQSVAGEEVRAQQDLGTILRENLGQTVELAWIDENGAAVTRDVNLPAEVEEGKPILGVGVSPLSQSQDVLDRYKGAFGANPLALLLPPTLQPTAVPYSDFMAPKYTSNVFGAAFAPIANLLFWLWFINFNVGIFNALPIGPLDGGQMYGALIEKKAKSAALAKNANMLLTLGMVAIVAGSLLLPHVIP